MANKPKHAKIRRRNSIETELPLEIRQELDRLLIEGITYEDAAAWCKSKGFNISRSAMGRYGKEFFEAYQNVKRFADQSRVLTAEVDDGMPMEEAVGKMILQKVMAALVDGTADVTENARLISGIASLQNAHVRLNKFKIDLEKRVKKAADAIGETARKAGVSEETILAIRRDVLRMAE